MQRMAMMILAFLLSVAPVAFAGSPHFTTCSATESGNTLSAEGKIAGLGAESQVHIVLMDDAACINPGGQDPKAANKETVTAEGTFPIQNGKALFSLDATAVLSPPCSPPMTLDLSNISVCDDEHGVCCSFD